MSSQHVFLSYAKEDREYVKQIHIRLQDDGFQPWLDEHDLLPGQDWDPAIRNAIRTSAAFLVFLSRNAVTKTGYIQKEILTALEVAERLPEGKTFVIPILIEDCTVPERLRKWHWIDLRTTEGYGRLRLALIQSAGLRARKRLSQDDARPHGLDAFDLMLYDVFKTSGRFLWGRIDRTRQAMSQGHFLVIRQSIPAPFRSLGTSMADHRKLSTATLEGLMPADEQWRQPANLVRQYRTSESYQGAIALSSAAATSYLNATYWKIALMSAPRPKVYVVGEKEPAYIEEGNQLRMIIMPLRLGDAEKSGFAISTPATSQASGT